MELSSHLDRSVLPAGLAHRVHLLVRVETWPDEGAGAPRTPLFLTLVLDRSGSMAGAKLWATIEASLELLGRLSPADRLAIVAYDDEVDLLAPLAPVAERAVFRAALEGLQPRGGTNLSGGWARGLSLLAGVEAEATACGARRRVLLLTDGQANRGVTEKEALCEIARQYRAAGVETTCFGFGADFNEQHLAAIAAAGGGRFHFIKSADQASAAFVQEFGELERVIGQNLEMVATLGPGATDLETLSDLPRAAANDRSVTLRLGDLLERDHRQALFAFRLPAHLTAGDLLAVALEVRYDAVRGKIGPRRHVLAVPVTIAPASAPLPGADPLVIRAVLLAEVLRAKALAARRLAAGLKEEARAELERARDLLEARLPSDRAGLAGELENVRRVLAELAEPAGPGAPGAGVAASGKTLTHQAHEQSVGRGAYQAAPEIGMRAWRLAPPGRGELDDVADAVRAELAHLGQPEEFVNNVEQVLRELADNALEHGGRGQASPAVEIEVHFGRNYVKVLVADSGPGFDPAAQLAIEEARSAAAPKVRGRGLLLVRELCDALEWNAVGNRVTATLRRVRLRIKDHLLARLDSHGVEPAMLVEIEGPLDGQSCSAFDDRLREIVERRGVRRIALDLTRCRYISSVGLGALIRLADEVGNRGGRLVLVAEARVLDALRIIGAERLFEFAATVAEARRLLEEA
ncbi:MAG: ATP-binding protein [Planctomycetes bacterium]|nr:ATP-binding protein [Planctomycetota bacterium]